MPATEAYFIEEPPEFDYRKGLFHVRQRIGNKTFERVMSPYVFMLALRRAAECASKHKFGGAEIINFPGIDADAELASG